LGGVGGGGGGGGGGCVLGGGGRPLGDSGEGYSLGGVLAAPIRSPRSQCASTVGSQAQRLGVLRLMPIDDRSGVLDGRSEDWSPEDSYPLQPCGEKVVMLAPRPMRTPPSSHKLARRDTRAVGLRQRRRCVVARGKSIGLWKQEQCLGALFINSGECAAKVSEGSALDQLKCTPKIRAAALAFKMSSIVRSRMRLGRHSARRGKHGEASL